MFLETELRPERALEFNALTGLLLDFNIILHCYSPILGTKRQVDTHTTTRHNDHFDFLCRLSTTYLPIYTLPTYMFDKPPVYFLLPFFLVGTTLKLPLLRSSLGSCLVADEAAFFLATSDQPPD